MLRVLVTCFEPYDEFHANASMEAMRIARELWAHNHRSTEVVWMTLPVDFGLAPQLLAEARATNHFSHVLHLGQAPGASTVRLEERAVNVRHGPHDAAPSALLPSAEAANEYRSELPLGDWVQSMLHEGLEVSLSQDAGQYLCNAVLYNSLHHAATGQQPRHAVFLHVPLLPEQATQAEGCDSTAASAPPPTELVPTLAPERAAQVVYRCLQHVAGTRNIRANSTESTSNLP